MAQPITELKERPGDTTFYEPAFMAILEDHRVYLAQESNGSTLVEVPPGEAWRFRFNFYGLLAHMDVRVEFRWITMRVNDLVNPKDYDGTLTTLRMPNLAMLNSLADIFNTQYRTS